MSAYISHDPRAQEISAARAQQRARYDAEFASDIDSAFDSFAEIRADVAAFIARHALELSGGGALGVGIVSILLWSGAV